MTDRRLLEEDELAVRARGGDMVALGQLWRGRERDVRTLSGTACVRLGKPHRREDAFEKAMAVFVFDAVPTYDENRGHFWHHARWRTWDRLRTWLIRSGGGTDPLEDDDEWTPDPNRPASPDDGDFTEDKDSAISVLRTFEGPMARNKWIVLRLLQVHGVSLRKATVALAVSSARSPDPVAEDVGAAWEAIAGLWLRLDLRMEPPPLPAVWPGCVELFCPHPAAGAVPEPPSPYRLKDPNTRAEELRRWYERVKRWYHRTTGETFGGLRVG